jgi:hypothetical protein
LLCTVRKLVYQQHDQLLRVLLSSSFTCVSALSK